LTQGRPRDEGTVLLLGLGLVALTLVLVGVVVDASRLYLTRRALAALADGAALAAAHDVDVAAVYRADRAPDVLPLSQGRAAADVAAYVRANAAPAGLGAVRVVSVQVVRVAGTDTVRVHLVAVTGAPLVGVVVGDGRGVTVDVEASARTAVQP
jgi:uncharacterized membrane protein